MTEDHMQYGNMVDAALRNVVLRALEQVASKGLPGEHHFYLTFKTWYPGVKIPDHLRERFDDEMTIVLQHQFWDLSVNEAEIKVTLSFNGKPEALEIPFPGLSGFFDPSVQFGLQFKVEGERPADDADNDPGEPPMASLITANQPELPAANSKGKDLASEVPGAEAGEEEGDDDGNVVTLDTFRKK